MGGFFWRAYSPDLTVDSNLLCLGATVTSAMSPPYRTQR
jgi:hypothetical protein